MSDKLREALQNASGFIDTPVALRKFGNDPFYTDVVASIRAALAQPQNDAEPAAYAVLTDKSHIRIWWLADKKDIAEKFVKNHDGELTPLYTAPPPELERMRKALELAEDVLSRAPFSTGLWPNGMHPQTGIDIIREALRDERDHASKECCDLAAKEPCVDCPAKYAPQECEVCGGDCSSANPPVIYCPAQERREEIAGIVRGIYGLGCGTFAGGHQDKSIERAVDRIQALPPAPKGEPSQEWNKAIEAAAKIADPWPGALDDKSTAVDRAIVEVRTVIAKEVRALRREPEGER